MTNKMISIPDSTRKLIHFSYKSLASKIPEEEKQFFLNPILENDKMFVYRTDYVGGLILGLVIICIEERELFFFKKQIVKISIVQANEDFSKTVTQLSDEIGLPNSDVDINWSMHLINKAMAMHGAVANTLKAGQIKLKTSSANVKGTWDDWFAAFKDEAGKHNPALAPDEMGLSLIDLMDDEPLRRAFGAEIEPRNHGKDFANQWDIMKMGF